MPTFIAMLRGINVSGQKIIKMDALRASLSALGLLGVQTYVQSGNVVFQAKKGPPAGLAAKIEGSILKDFGFDVTVVVRGSEEMDRVIRSNPFLKENKIDPARLYVTFLSEPPTETALGNLKALAAEPDRFHVSGREVYIHCPTGYGRTKLSNTTFERMLKTPATTRNWKTVNQLLAMARESSMSGDGNP